MNLFTSNSNARIHKTLSAFVLIFTLYYLLITFVDPQVTVFQNQWSANYAAAQEYIYTEKNFHTVILGSSMSNRLLVNELDKGIYNLAFAGGSVLTGLNIIKKSGKIPAKIIIETNAIERGTDKEMIDRIFSPFWRSKRLLPMLQEKYHPINVIMSFIRQSFFPSKKEGDYKPDPIAFEKRLNHTLEAMKNTKTFEISELQGLLKSMQDNGAQIIFFRMPVHPQIASSLSYKEKIEFLKNEFSHYVWLPMPEDIKYATTDGIHLTYSGAAAFSGEIFKWITECNKKSRFQI